MSCDGVLWSKLTRLVWRLSHLLHTCPRAQPCSVSRGSQRLLLPLPALSRAQRLEVGHRRTGRNNGGGSLVQFSLTLLRPCSWTLLASHGFNPAHRPLHSTAVRRYATETAIPAGEKGKLTLNLVAPHQVRTWQLLGQRVSRPPSCQSDGVPAHNWPELEHLGCGTCFKAEANRSHPLFALARGFGNTLGFAGHDLFLGHRPSTRAPLFSKST